MQVLEKYFDTAFDAPDGIKKLRDLILTLAIQGKLVPQDSNDQPASELLEKLKKIKNIPVVNSNEMSFSLPLNWKWEKIVNLGITQTGTTPPKKDPDYYGDYIPFMGPGNIKNGVIDYSGEGLSEKGIEKGRLIKKDSILMVCIGGSIGKHAITNQDISCNQQINTLTVYSELSTQYVYWAMASQYFQKTVINQSGGSATPIINKLKWSSIPIPVPPLNEQKRIVKKINQLMALCDELEKLKQQKDLKKLTVHKSAINQLLDSKDKNNSQKGWHFISNHFNDLYTVKENVSELRSVILQLAMQGKLVPQDPNDQPASKLLKEIEKEKEQLIENGKIKKLKPSTPIKDSEIPFTIPNSWKWCRVGALLDSLIGGYAYNSSEFIEQSDNQVLRLGNIRPSFLRVEANPVFISDDLANSTLNFKLSINDILITMTGTRGKKDYCYTVLIEEKDLKDRNLFLNQRVGCLRFNQNIYASFFNLALKNDILLDSIYKTATGSANQANIGSTALNTWVVPLPPLSEQKRIVEKINQLMALCDDLEKQIENSSSKQTELLNAIMSNLGK